MKPIDPFKDHSPKLLQDTLDEVNGKAAANVFNHETLIEGCLGIQSFLKRNVPKKYWYELTAVIHSGQSSVYSTMWTQIVNRATIGFTKAGGLRIYSLQKTSIGGPSPDPFFLDIAKPEVKAELIQLLYSNFLQMK